MLCKTHTLTKTYFLKHPTKTYLDDEPEEESDGWEEYDEIIGLD